MTEWLAYQGAYKVKGYQSNPGISRICSERQIRSNLSFRGAGGGEESMCSPFMNKHEVEGRFTPGHARRARPGASRLFWNAQ